MLELKVDYFFDSEITGLLMSGGEDDFQTVEDFLFTLLSLYEISPNGEPLSKALIEDWHIFADENSFSHVLGLLGNPFRPDDSVGYVAEYREYIQAWEEVKAEREHIISGLLIT